MALIEELINLRHRHLMTQQGFGRHNDQRFAELAVHLPAQNVEVIRGRGAIRDLNIVLSTKLQIAFKPR